MTYRISYQLQPQRLREPPTSHFTRSIGATVTLHPMDVPFDLGETRSDPRASRLTLLHQPRTELWIGGWLSAVGPQLRTAHLHRAWIVDCSGELPEELRSAAALVIPSVFDDVEAVPPRIQQLKSLALDLASTISLDAAPARFPGETPDRVYVLCKQGLNRSAFLAGLILQALAPSSGDIVGQIRDCRPGSLSNQVFQNLLRPSLDEA